MQLKDFLKDTLDLGSDDVLKVDVKEGFSFFNTDGEHTEKVMNVLNGFDMNGRRINVEISKNDGGGRRDHNGRNSGGFGGGRSSGGFRGERSGSAPRREGGFRSDRNNSAPKREGGFRGERSSSAPRREGSFSDRPRRSDSTGDTPRPRKPRRS
jgi:ATP-dependent RNA helicase DeaD